jgi:hypothetical protein
MSLRDLDLLKVFMENHGGFPDQRRFIAGKSIELNVLDLQFVDDFFMRIGYNGISWDIMGYCGCYRQKQSYETLPSSLQTWQWTIPHFWRTFAMENPHSVHGFPPACHGNDDTVLGTQEKREFTLWLCQNSY